MLVHQPQRRLEHSDRLVEMLGPCRIGFGGFLVKRHGGSPVLLEKALAPVERPDVAATLQQDIARGRPIAAPRVIVARQG